MEALSLKAFSVAPIDKSLRVFGKRERCSLRRKKMNVVSCQVSGGNNVNFNAAMKSGDGFYSVLSSSTSTTTSATTTTQINGDHQINGASSGSLVLTPSTTTTTTTIEESDDDAIVNDLMSSDIYGSSSQASISLVLEKVHEGIGIVKFLRGKGFFITGATGFLAKVLVEKILRTAPDVGKIFLLIKAKNKEAAMERLKNEIINAELFMRIRQHHGKSYQAFMLSKLIPVVGDVSDSNLGLDPNLADVIANEVDVIVNSAANTTFHERYDVAININTRGPSHVMSFATKCKKLKLFLQVSTAYVNGQRQGRVMEKAFRVGDNIASETDFFSHEGTPLTLDIEGEIKLASDYRDVINDENLIAQKMKELGTQRANTFGWQDTYVFTKAMGEMMIDKMRGEIPVVIVRPSVVESTCKEPFPGWMEGNRMMDPIVLYYGNGQLTGFLADPNGVLDIVPADMVVNATLAAIATHGAAQKPGINIYQVASSVVNPLVFQDLARLFYEHYNSSPSLDSKGRPIHVPSMKVFSSKEEFSDHLWRDATHRTRLMTMSNSDTKLSRKLEIICRKTVEKAKYLAQIYEPYTFYGGRFDNSNTQGLMERMNEEEKYSFGFDVQSIDWKDYITNVHIPGLRKHVMKGRK